MLGPLTPKERRRLDQAARDHRGDARIEVVTAHRARYSVAHASNEGGACDSQDKVTIITGGGGGMGRVAAQMFAEQGARVVVAEFSEAAGEETVDLVRAAGGEATFVRADVSKEADAKAMVDHAVATYGRLDCLYNNAGVMPEADHSVTDTDVDDLGRRSWRSTSAGVFLGCKYAIPAMIEGGRRLDHQHRELRRASSAAASRRTPTRPRRARSCR